MLTLCVFYLARQGVDCRAMLLKQVVEVVDFYIPLPRTALVRGMLLKQVV